MAVDSDQMWDLMIEASDDLAGEIGLGVESFSPRALGAIDRWVGEHDGPLDEEDCSRLGLLLARILVETHGGGLLLIRHKGHPLDGERAVAGFARGLANDYHVPFLISAARIGVDRSLTAREWYEQIRREGR
jgi:hypothetical protein